MRRRMIQLSLLALITTLLFTACSSQTKSALDPRTPTTVTLWHYYVGQNQIAIDTAVDAFNKEVGLKEGVIVVPVAFGSIMELEQNLIASAQGHVNSKPMPSLASSYADVALEISSLDKVVDLNAYFTAEEQAAYVPEFLHDAKFNQDQLLLLPIVKSTEVLYLNATAWDAFSAQNGYSLDDMATWEGVYDVARAYFQWTDAQTPDTPWDGLSFLGIDSLANYIIAANRQMGVEIIQSAGDGSGQVNLDLQVLRRIFDNYYKGGVLHYYNAYGKFRADDIKTGDLIAYCGSTSGASYFPNSIIKNHTEYEITPKILPFPHFAQGDAYAIRQGAGMCVYRTTPAAQEGAALFLKWFTSKDNNIAFASTTGYLPAVASVYSLDGSSAELSALFAYDEAHPAVAPVYEVALSQIAQSQTYSITPFANSYDVRTLLQSSLADITHAGRLKAEPLMAQGMDEAALLDALDLDAQFALWIDTIKTDLDTLLVSYK